MPTRQLTEMVVRKAALPKSGQYVIWDQTLSGFGVRISQGGAKSFVVMFYEGKRKRRVTVGKYPTLGLAGARSEAKRILANVALGGAPEMPSQAESEVTFSDALDLFIKTHCKKHNRERTAKETERLLRKHFESKLGRMALANITPQKVAGIIDRLLERPSEANHAFSAIRKFFNWTCDRQHIERSPCERLRQPAKPRARERVLDDDEIVKIFETAQDELYPYGSIVVLLLLTGQRRQEIAGLRWDDIDLDRGMITVPAERNKSNRPHVLPITLAVGNILDGLPRLGSNVFPARGNPSNTFSGFSKSKRALDEQCGVTDWTLHDLRRTAATNMARLGVLPHVVERILNHSTGTISGVAAIYNRFQYLDEMRDALRSWEERVQTLVRA